MGGSGSSLPSASALSRDSCAESRGIIEGSDIRAE